MKQTTARGACVLLSVPWLLGFFLLCGCTDPGPRALLKGQKYIQQGNYEQAIEQLQTAVHLIPTNAQAWNHLGLAYHGHKQPELAIKAYRQALLSDKDLVAAHYNLGCLLLEQNNPGAIEELTSFVLLQKRSVEGRMKLGAAYLRARKPDPAEREFRAAMDLQPQNPEVFNCLGMVQMQRRRYTDALAYFNQALVKSSNYGPAILNAAVTEQTRNNNPAALKLYRQYLTLQPRPDNWGNVLNIANKLDADLNPAVPRLVQSSYPPFMPQTNLPPVRSNVVIRPAPTSTPPAIVSIATKTNVPLRTNLIKGATALIASASIKTSTPPVLVAPSNPVTASVRTTPPPVLVKAPPPTNKPSDLEVTQVRDDLVIRPPQDVTGTSGSTKEPTGTSALGPGTSVNSPGSTNEKRGFLSSLNPFRTRPKTGASANEVRETEPEVTSSSTTDEPVPVFPRYTFLSPARPVPGKRSEAEPYFLGGLKMQQSSKWPQAIAYYQKATELDPAYFEAYYNQGLAAYEAGNWKIGLSSFEHALAMKPDSVDARYNFALTLKQGGYVPDAVSQLEKIVQTHDEETRAHFSLANLYAKKLNQPSMARDHYLKVIQNDPQHPNGAEIRYWLAAHP